MKNIYETIGQAMARIRRSQEKKWTQENVAEHLGIDRTVYAKFEIGKLKINYEYIKKFCQLFDIEPDELNKKISFVIPDTSALLKSGKLLKLLLEDYDKIIIPNIVQKELDYQKDKGKRKSRAWRVLMYIAEFKTKYPEKFLTDNTVYNNVLRNDEQIIELAENISKKEKIRVDIIHDDVGFSVRYDNNILLRDYIAKRSKLESLYFKLIKLDNDFENYHTEYYNDIDENILNQYLPDGLTPLISCIRHNFDIKRNEKEGKIITNEDLIKKILFYITRGANINKMDSKDFNFSPLTHCVQINNFAIFSLLLKKGADFNAGSQDETNTDYVKTQNESNTALMVACWHGRIEYVKKLCELDGICLNQQDGNGYTALMKCAIQIHNSKNNREKNLKFKKIYDYLLKQGADKLIRDRKNRTAEDLLKLGAKNDY